MDIDNRFIKRTDSNPNPNPNPNPNLNPNPNPNLNPNPNPNTLYSRGRSLSFRFYFGKKPSIRIKIRFQSAIPIKSQILFREYSILGIRMPLPVFLPFEGPLYDPRSLLMY